MEEIATQVKKVRKPRAKKQVEVEETSQPVMNVKPIEAVEARAKKPRKYGTREEVYNGLCEMTKGKLKKEDLLFEAGKYKSVKAKERALTNRSGGVLFTKKE